jgi:glycosyltransferase involved in cell wall biosynthesis
MATYKQSKFLRTALLSCFNQTYENYEVVVVSVNGDKDTDEVLSDFPFPFRWITSDKADYVYQRNLGIKNAKGEWITLADSDDVYLPHKLSSEVEVAERENAYIVTSGFFICDENLNIREAYIPPPEITREMLLRSCLITDLCLVNRRIYEEFGLYDEAYSEVAFYRHWLRVAEEYPDKIKTNRQPVFMYRIHPEQMHRNLNPEWQMKMRQKVKEESLARKPLK